MSAHWASPVQAGAAHSFPQQLRPLPHAQSIGQVPHPSPASHSPFPQQGVFCPLTHAPEAHVLSVQLPVSPEHPVCGPLSGRLSQTKPVLAPQSSEVQGFPSSQLAGHWREGVGVGVGAGVGVGVSAGVGEGVGLALTFGPTVTHPMKSQAAMTSATRMNQSSFANAMSLLSATVFINSYEPRAPRVACGASSALQQTSVSRLGYFRTAPR